MILCIIQDKNQGHLSDTCKKPWLTSKICAPPSSFLSVVHIITINYNMYMVNFIAKFILYQDKVQKLFQHLTSFDPIMTVKFKVTLVISCNRVNQHTNSTYIHSYIKKIMQKVHEGNKRCLQEYKQVTKVMMPSFDVQQYIASLCSC